MKKKRFYSNVTNNLISMEGVRVEVNDSYYGFRTSIIDVGRCIVCHKRYVESFNGEMGFYICPDLVGIRHLFQVKVKDDTFHHWIYDPANKNRLMSEVFVSTARLQLFSNVEPISKPRRKS